MEELTIVDYAATGNISAVLDELNKGVDINMVDNRFGETALIAAVHDKNEDLIKLLKSRCGH